MEFESLREEERQNKHLHVEALKKAHETFTQCLFRPDWGADDFFLAMSVYREAAGIEFDIGDDASLDKWLDGAAAAWGQELTQRGDGINLGEVLEKAIAAGMKAIGL